MTASRTDRPGRRRWSPRDERWLRELYPDQTAAFCAQVLGRSVGQVYQKANAMGLAKSPAFWASDLSGRVRRGHEDPRMVASRFQPGVAPWNKGKPGSAGLHPNSRATQFRPGRRPEEARNYLPIGSLRITKDGLERKLTDDPALAPARRWTPVHRLVWEAAHGPVPRGHIVVFRPGAKTTVLADVTLDRLECISRAEHARRNHPRSKSPELAELVQLRGQITRQVNRINREAEPAQQGNP